MVSDSNGSSIGKSSRISALKQAAKLGLFLSAIFALTPATADLPAFPGAEGGGALAVGGRGGQVCRVTNLNDSGPGSLRACIEMQGPRTVIFSVGGTIWLESPLVLRNSYITIAGQTAPGGGIQISGKRIPSDTPGWKHIIYSTASHVIIRYLRLRNGLNDPPNPGGPDTVSLGGGTDVILDHLSLFWGHDENVGIAGGSGFTVQNSILAEALAGHTVNLLVSGGSQSNNLRMVDIDFHNNLLANSSHRHPLVRSHRIRFINNIVYNWRLFTSELNGGIHADFIGNLYKPGPETKNSRSTSEIRSYVCGFGSYPDCPVSEFIGDAPSLYVTGNTGPYHGTDDQFNMVQMLDNPNGYSIGQALPPEFRREAPLVPAGMTISARDVRELEGHLLPNVGASKRLDCAGNWVPNRDWQDVRIVKEYNNNQGVSGPASEDEVGGFPVLLSGDVCKDTSGDGIPDDWLVKNGLNPIVPIGAEIHASGYSMLELYLNGLNLHEPGLEALPHAPSGLRID